MKVSTNQKMKISISGDTSISNIKKVDVETAETAGEQLIRGFELIVTKMVETSAMDADKSQQTCESGLYSHRAPSISIKKYLERIHHFFSCSDECFTLALVFINRICKRRPEMTVCDRSVHRMLFFSMILAAKVHDDVSYKNSYYAKVGGLETTEVNATELEFMKLLDWKTFVGTQEYNLYHGFLFQAANHGVPMQTPPVVEPEREPSPARTMAL